MVIGQAASSINLQGSFKAKYAIAFNSGTSTLHSALLAGGISPGDEVISPALTCIMNTSSTIHANAVPVYADISPETFTIDPLDIEKKINHKTKAIVVVAMDCLAIWIG